MKSFVLPGLLFTLLTLFVLPLAADEKKPPESSPGVVIVTHDKSLFGPDPSYAEKPYDPEAQLIIYGGKTKVKTARPLLELGRRLYWDGPIREPGTVMGHKNPNDFWFYAFGDWRTAVGYNNKANNGKEFGRLATKLNLDFDLKLTSTERIHAFLTPLDKDGQFTRVDFGTDVQDSDLEWEDDAVLDTLYFEGDFGPIFAGFSGKDNALDLPFSFGLVPIFTQNGVWAEDAVTGFMITPLSAKNSPKLNISNYDVTFFAAFDRISTAAFKKAFSKANEAFNRSSEDTTKMYGVFGFAEANRGYWEWGYGYLDSDFDGGDYHNVTISHTRRIRHKLSNSVRVIANLGQEGLFNPDTNRVEKTANGVLLLIENSLITSKPSTLVPYFNIFAGFDHPQALVRAAGAGGVLKNTGLNFEGEAITALANLDANANNTAGAAIGVEYLFNLDMQLVIEGAFVIPYGDENDRIVKENQFGIDVRYQIPVTNAWIFRFDIFKAFLQDQEDTAGVRVEIRRKF